MLRRLRTIIFVIIAAALGAVLGRIALQARERVDAGESPADIDLGQVSFRVQDVIPGLVAAFRVKDAPWSWFHIPAWLAAFAVNLAVGAAGGDIAALKSRAERMAFDAVGLDAREFGMGGDWEDDEASASGAVSDAEDGADTSSARATWASTPPPAPPPAGD